MDTRIVARMWRIMLACLVLPALLAAPFPALAQRIAGGAAHTLALRADGTLWAWGSNPYGQLGDGTSGTEAHKSSPVRVTKALDGSALPVFTAVSAGWYHSLALAADGTLWAWGSNADGQLGDGTTIDRTSPVRVTVIDGIGQPVSFTAVSAGIYHSLALAVDGTILACGDNDYGQLGDGTTIDRTSPVRVTVIDGIGQPVSFTAVAAGIAHSLALAADGTLWAWGDNYHGQLGDGTSGTGTDDRTSPVRVTKALDGSALPVFTAVSAGGDHSLALAADGTLWAWGYNLYGQLGDGTSADRTSPVRVTKALDDSALPVFTAVSAGENHSLALAADGTLWAWGSNADGQLGGGTSGTGTDDRTSPVQIPVIDGSGQPVSFTAIAAGDYYSLALAADGTILACGDNDYGQLGDGTTTEMHAPVGVVGPDALGYFDASLDIFPDGAEGEAPLTVGFSSFYTPRASPVGWDFGDGQISSDAKPNHTFDTPGLYTVTFTEEVPGGGTTSTPSEQSTTVTVQVLDSGSGGGGGGGCAMSPSAGFGLEWLLLFAPLALARLRRSGRRVN